MPKLENKYQSTLIKKIKAILPGALVLKGNSQYNQGVPDLLILVGKRWASLEVKKSEKDASESELQPNQGYYVDLMNKMSYSAFIYPENEAEILDELQRSLKSSGDARISQR